MAPERLSGGTAAGLRAPPADRRSHVGTVSNVLFARVIDHAAVQINRLK